MTRTSGPGRWRRCAFSLAVVLAWRPAARADLFPCQCHSNQPCCPPYYHPWYGYYPTQWRAWSVAEPAATTPPRPVEVPGVVPTAYPQPTRLTVERIPGPLPRETAEPPRPQPAPEVLSPQPTLLNLNPGSAWGVESNRAAQSERPAVLNLGGVSPQEYPGMSYRDLP
jgi:hypothetical protein